MWVAGKRLIAQGVDDTSRARDAPSSVPEMWVSALSAVRVTQLLWYTLEVLIGDLGDIVPWDVKPEDLVGKCSRILGEPWGNRHTCDAVRKAAVMDITTQVLLVIPRRAFTRWYRSVRSFTKLAEIPAGSVFNNATNLEPLLIFFYAPFHASAPFHDKKIMAGLQDNGLVRNLRRTHPSNRTEAHLRELRRVIERVSRLPEGSSLRVLQNSLAAAISEAAERHQSDAGAPS